MATSSPTNKDTTPKITHDAAAVVDPRVIFYDVAYKEENTIWDSGRPQPALQQALTKYETDTTKTVLEVGCGRARPLLMMAERGFTGLGIDSSEHAIEEATKTAQQHDLSDRVKFKTFDYRSLSTLGAQFDIVIDCAFSHILSLEQRQVYAEQICTVMKPGGHLYILSYSGKAEITSQMIRDRVLPPNFQGVEGWTMPATATATTGTGTGAPEDKKQEQPSSSHDTEFSIPPGMTEQDIHTLYPPEKGWEINSIETATFVAANGATGPCLLSIITYVGEGTSQPSPAPV